MEEANLAPLQPKKKWQTILVTALIIGGAAVTTIAVYSSYRLYQFKNPAYQEKLAEEVTAKVLHDVGKIIELPAGVPQIAVVSEVEKLPKDQLFFAKAAAGDYIIIFETQAILYRPRTKKIMAVAAVNRDEPKVPAPAPVTAPVKPRVRLPAVTPTATKR